MSTRDRNQVTIIGAGFGGVCMGIKLRRAGIPCTIVEKGNRVGGLARYAAGTREILEAWFEDKPIRPEYLIVEGGKLAGTGALSYQK